MSEPIKHLLKPKEFRVWCLSNRAPGPKMQLTIFASKATCARCLTNMRWAGGKKRGKFKVVHTGRAQDPQWYEPQELKYA